MHHDYDKLYSVCKLMHMQYMTQSQRTQISSEIFQCFFFPFVILAAFLLNFLQIDDMNAFSILLYHIW